MKMKTDSLRNLLNIKLSRIINELPLLLVLIILLWAQYTISISLVLNYLLLTRNLVFFGLSIWIPFNLFWSSTIINLFRCVITGPGWVNKSPPNSTSTQPTPPDLDLERQRFQQTHKIHHARPITSTTTTPAHQPTPYSARELSDPEAELSDLEDEIGSDLEQEHTSSVPLLSQNHHPSPSTSSSSNHHHDSIPMSNRYRPRQNLLLPRPPLTSTLPPSYLADHLNLPSSSLSFQEQVQRQHQSLSHPSDLLALLNSPPPLPLPSNHHERSQRPESLMCKSDGSLRFCRKCDHYKADRSHHCSSCGRCVLRMDHHCPWLGGRCVGLNNHKFFILFLLSSSITSIISAFAAGKGLMDFVSNTRLSAADPFQLAPLNWAFLLLVGGLFGMVLAGFTSYHLYLISVNRTTIENMERSVRIRPTGTRDPSESYALLRTTRLRAFDSPNLGTGGLRIDEPCPSAVVGNHVQDGERQGAEEIGQPPKLPSYNLPIYKSDDQLSRLERRKLEAGATKLNLFDLGSTRENFKQIFGVHSPVWQWLLPVHPKGISDGYQYPINHRNLHKLIELTSEIRLLPNERSNELRYERP